MPDPWALAECADERTADPKRAGMASPMLERSIEKSYRMSEIPHVSLLRCGFHEYGSAVLLAKLLPMEPQSKNIERPGTRPTGVKSQARLDFAHRLRELRVPRGYRTARSLAKALGIDENRYTRYERAEVEPDLALIRRICAVLAISPSDLLGLPDADAGADNGEASDAAAETGSDAGHRGAGGADGVRYLGRLEKAGAATAGGARDEQPVAGGPRTQRPIGADFAAWTLACVAAEARLQRTLQPGQTQVGQTQAGSPHAGPPQAGQQSGQSSEDATSLRLLASASPIYNQLREAPFETIAELAADEAIATSPSPLPGRVVAAIEALIDALQQQAGQQAAVQPHAD